MYRSSSSWDAGPSPTQPPSLPPSPIIAAPGTPVLESVRWVAPRAILASLLATNPDEDTTNDDGVGNQREEDDVIYMGVTWEGWDGTAAGEPQGVAVTELGVYFMGVSHAGAEGCGWFVGWLAWAGFVLR
jgi:hypothetical protein